MDIRSPLFESNYSTHDMEENGKWIRSMHQKATYHCTTNIHSNQSDQNKHKIYKWKIKIKQMNSKSQICVGLIKKDTSMINICNDLDRIQSIKKWITLDKLLIFGFLRGTNLFIPSNIVEIILSNYMHHLTKSHRLQKEIEYKTLLINDRKQKVEQELSEANPALQATKKALSNVNKRQLNEIKSLRNPPKLIRMTFEAVAIILEIKLRKYKQWETVQKMLANSNFMSDVLRVDPRARIIKHKARKKIMKNYMTDQDWTYEKVMRASFGAAPFVLWAQTMVKYSHLIDSCEPMEREIAEMLNKLQDKQYIVDNEYKLMKANKLEMSIWDLWNGYLIYNKRHSDDVLNIKMYVKEDKIEYKLNEQQWEVLNGISVYEFDRLAVVMIGECEIEFI
eukprot:263892_1